VKERPLAECAAPALAGLKAFPPYALLLFCGNSPFFAREST
jgi:hypothetical protein